MQFTALYSLVSSVNLALHLHADHMADLRASGLAGGRSPTTVVVTQPTVTFIAFTLKADIVLGPPGAFAISGKFTLGAKSNGINAVAEDVSLKIGTSSVTIPAGSFVFHPAKKNTGASFTFEGEIDNVLLDVRIADLGGGSIQLQAEGQGADLTGTTNPVTVSLAIGDDGGSTTVNANFVGVGLSSAQ